MKLSLLKAAILFALIFATTAYGQIQGLSFNYFGGGARSEGMGQAFLAVSNDGTAGGWNPAGLQFHEKTLMSFSYSFLLPRGKYTYDINQSGNIIDHNGTIGGLNYWHFISPIRVKGHHVVLNGGYTRYFDVYYLFGESLTKNLLGDEPNAVYERHGGISAINFGFGTRLYKQLSMGVTGNIYYGRVVTDESRYFAATDTIFGEYALYESDVRIIDSTKYTGFNSTIGFTWSKDEFSAGLVFKTPFNLKGESDTTHYMLSYLNGVNIASDPFDQYRPQGDLTYGIFKTDTVYVDDITSRMQMPLMVGLGMAYNINDNWLIASDVEYRGFSGKKVESLVLRTYSAGFELKEDYADDIVTPRWKDVWQYRIGTEYMLGSSIGEIPLRMGFRNESFPQGDLIELGIKYQPPKGQDSLTSNDSTRAFYIFDYSSTDKITGYSIAFGTGIHWTNIQLDLAYTYSKFDQDIYVPKFNPETNLYDLVLKSENEWKNHHLNFTFTGYF